jgi:MFS family permease
MEGDSAKNSSDASVRLRVSAWTPRDAAHRVAAALAGVRRRVAARVVRRRLVQAHVAASAPASPFHASPAAVRPVRLPLWTWSYVSFRFGDGLASALIPLAAVLHYGEPLWVLALMVAIMNLAGVPATFLWGKRMDQGSPRRPIVVMGFAATALAMVMLATLPPFPLFVAGAVLYTVFGVATAPAASTMVLQRVPRARWGRTTAALSRRTGFSYLAGLMTSILIVSPSSWWAALGLEWAATTDLLGGPHFVGQFATAGFLAAVGAFVAWRTVAPFQPPLPHEPGFDTRFVQATQRRFERPVYFPGRIFSVPTLGAVASSFRDPHRLWPLGYTLTFMGSVCFFASYPGVLAKELALPAGLVLLAQLPSNLVTPMIYPWAGRWGSRAGESRGVLMGALLRTVTLPVLAVLVVASGPGITFTFPLLLLLHASMGLSFALLQVNGPIILAEVHPGGRGQGVGTYHASVGLGSLLGSASAALLIGLLDYRWSYAFAILVGLAGAYLLWTAHKSHGVAATETGRGRQ